MITAAWDAQHVWMRSLLLTALVLLTAPSAFAEWRQYGSNSQGTVFYIDIASLQKDGNFRRVWELQDFKVPTLNALSVSVLMEYDCSSKRNRALAMSAFSGHMAVGRLVRYARLKNDEWNSVRPDSVFANALLIVCN